MAALGLSSGGREQGRARLGARCDAWQVAEAAHGGLPAASLQVTEETERGSHSFTWHAVSTNYLPGMVPGPGT